MASVSRFLIFFFGSIELLSIISSLVKTQIVLSSEKIIESFLETSNVIQLIGNDRSINSVGGFINSCSENLVYSCVFKLYSMT